MKNALFLAIIAGAAGAAAGRDAPTARPQPDMGGRFVKTSLPADSSLEAAAESGGFPKVWMCVTWREPFEDSVRLCAEQGVDVVEVPTWSVGQCENILALLRKYGVKGFTHSGFNPPQDVRPTLRHGRPCERAVCSGGAYRGLSIDRNLFSFTPGPHEIVVEPPVYSKHQPYTRRVKGPDGVERTEKDGHYFGNIVPTGEAEIIVPERLFDGAPHVRIIRCEVLPPEPGDTPENDSAAGLSGTEIDNRRLLRLKFDLTDCADCLLDKVGIAVYWMSDTEGEKWKGGRGDLSVFSPLTRGEMRRAGHYRAEQWVLANDGTFPSGEIIAIRFGDENFNLTGWLDCPSASFPLWGFSQSGRAAFEAAEGGRFVETSLPNVVGTDASGRDAPTARPRLVQPRTWGHPEIYGAEAYGIALYEYHKAAAALVREFREGIHEVTSDMLVFRNTTRAGSWAEGNDHDGSGQELLTRELDFLHLDPYPVAEKYNAETIPADTAYMAGLARRYGKPLLPWMQAHAASWLALGHPTPADMDRMWAQHLPFAPAGMMWLGFDNDPKGNFCTFPHGSPKSWAHAKEMFAALHTAGEPPTPPETPLALVRPYSTRAICCSLGDGSWRNPADRILETFALAWSVDNGLQYDVFELPPSFGKAPFHEGGGGEAVSPTSAPFHEGGGGGAAGGSIMQALSRYPRVVSTIPLPGVANVRVLGEGTEGTIVTAKELAAMRKAFAAEIANTQFTKP